MVTVSIVLAIRIVLGFAGPEAAMHLAKAGPNAQCNYWPEYALVVCEGEEWITEVMYFDDINVDPGGGYRRLWLQDATWTCPEGQWLCINPRQWSPSLGSATPTPLYLEAIWEPQCTRKEVCAE